MSTDKNVNIELSLHGSESFKVTPRDHLMPMDQSDLEVANLYDFGLGELAHINVEITSDGMHLGLSRSKVLEPLKSLTYVSMHIIELTSLDPMLPGDKTY